MSPPESSTPNGITGTRPKAEIRRATATRFQAAARAAGIDPLSGWQIRSLLSSLIANRDEPTDEQVITALMAAPWFPKPRRRRYQIGEAGWRVRS